MLEKGCVIMKKESTKKQFLIEALRLFAEFGYDSVSISQIAERVGCSAPALYKHYSGKHALFDEIGVHVIGRVGTTIITAVINFYSN